MSHQLADTAEVTANSWRRFPVFDFLKQCIDSLLFLFPTQFSLSLALSLHLKAAIIDPYSAETHPQVVDPRAVQVMAEVGAPISQQQPNNVRDLLAIPFDHVVTVCDSASESCPVFPGKTRVIHHSFDDPPALAKNRSDSDAVLSIYRRVRDEIRAFVETLPEALDKGGE